MKLHVIAGWSLLALEAAVVLMLALQHKMGDDAAGRGMASGFALLLAPVVPSTGALLWWGRRGGPAAAWWLGFCIVVSPVVFVSVNFSSGMLKKIDRGLWQAQQSRFADGRLSDLARAIDAQDRAAVQRLLAAGPVDWRARDRWGRTLLGHAIQKALDTDGASSRPAFVHLLLAAGAPPADDALAAHETSASVSEHNLVYHLYGVHSPNALAVMDMVLAAGASPEVVDEDGRPIYFSTYTVLPALEVLARHGANFTLLDPRTDRLQHTALMNAASMQMWAEAAFFLRHGVSPEHRAPDGQTLQSILAEVDTPGSTYTGADAQAHADFRAALAPHSPGH